MRNTPAKSQRGVAAIEFALLLPLLLLTVFGIVEFGTVYYRQQLLTGAVREGARAGVIGTNPKPSSSQISQRVTNYLAGVGLDSSKVSVTITGAQGASGTPLTVTASYPASLALVSIFAPSVDESIEVSASVVMEIE